MEVLKKRKYYTKTYKKNKKLEMKERGELKGAWDQGIEFQMNIIQVEDKKKYTKSSETNSMEFFISRDWI